MIDLKHKYAFIHIPKTGGTSINTKLQTDNCIFCHKKWSTKANMPDNHLTLSLLEKYFEGDLSDYFIFTFVRNPWDKVISECFCPHTQYVFRDCVDISSRINRVCSLSSKGYGGHFLKQTLYTESMNHKLDFIGKFENLQEDFDNLCCRINIDPIILPVLNKTEHHNYKSYYDDQTQKLVYDTYKDDIELFDYSF